MNWLKICYAVSKSKRLSTGSHIASFYTKKQITAFGIKKKLACQDLGINVIIIRNHSIKQMILGAAYMCT